MSWLWESKTLADTFGHFISFDSIVSWIPGLWNKCLRADDPCYRTQWSVRNIGCVLLSIFQLSKRIFLHFSGKDNWKQVGVTSNGRNWIRKLCQKVFCFISVTTKLFASLKERYNSFWSVPYPWQRRPKLPSLLWSYVRAGFCLDTSHVLHAQECRPRPIPYFSTEHQQSSQRRVAEMGCLPPRTHSNGTTQIGVQATCDSHATFPQNDSSTEIMCGHSSQILIWCHQHHWQESV